MEKEKPPVLSDEQLEQLLEIDFATAYSGHIAEYRLTAEAQRDADVEWYDKHIIVVETPGQKQDIMLMMGNVFEELIQQARQEVAREIFGEIENNYSTAMPIGSFIISESELQSLKDKFLK